MQIRRAVAVVAMVVFGAAAGHAAEPPSGQTSAVRIIRVVGHPGAAHGRTAAAEITLEVGSRTIPFQAERVDVLRGDVLGADVLAEISPYKPSLRLVSSERFVRMLEMSTAWDTVTITGYQRPGSREFLVSSLDVARAGGGKPAPAERSAYTNLVPKNGATGYGDPPRPTTRKRVRPPVEGRDERIPRQPK